MSKTMKGFIFAILAGTCWGTFGTLVSFLASFGFSETAIGILGPALMVVFFLARILIQKPHVLKVDLRGLIIYILVGIIGVIGSTWCYAVALNKGVPIAVGSVLTFLNYFIVMIAARFIWNNKITIPKVFSGILSILEAPLVNIMYSLDPVVASILGFAIFKQSLTVFQFIGIVVIFGSLTWLQLAERALERKIEADNKKLDTIIT